MNGKRGKKVWVVQEPPKVKVGDQWIPKFDINKAKKFGEIHIVFSWHEARELSPYDMLIAAMKRIDYQEGDHLLAIGNPRAIIICALVVTMQVDIMNLLLHDRQLDDYRLEVLPLTNKENEHGHERIDEACEQPTEVGS